jgi:hypothetical protein
VDKHPRTRCRPITALFQGLFKTEEKWVVQETHLRQKGTAEAGAVMKSDPEKLQKMMEAYQMMRKLRIG